MTEVPIDVAELAKKSSVSWIRADGETYPVWHEWVETTGEDGASVGAICVVGSSELDGSEQRLPRLGNGDAATVLLRGKIDRQLAASVPVVTTVVEPGSELWAPVTAALKSGRLNAPDLATMVERWARECQVLRLLPAEAATPAAELADVHPRTSPRLS